MGKDIQANGGEGDNENGHKLTKDEKEKLRKAKLKNKKKEKQKQKKLQEKDEVDENTYIKQIIMQNSQNTAVQSQNAENNNEINNNNNNKQEEEEQIEEDIEYIEDEEYLLTGKYYEEFKHVFQNFQANAKKMISKISEQDEENKEQDEEQTAIFEKQKQDRKDTKKKDREEKQNKVSRKKKKQLRWLKVAQLKALVKRPDLVEAWDITASDPLTLVYMKSLRNNVPVPKHWSQKRRFLQSKRGIMKMPFKLPEFIENTGISKLRDPFVMRDGQAMVRQKLKERMNPKMGKIDIDYEVLHDAFFKFQTKSKLTVHGDIYFEGKEEEIKSQMFKPGKLSSELRAALGISDYAPPPWLINMQRYGPPPSYPYLRVKGLNYSESLLQSGFLTKEQIEHASKYINQPGVYATFKSVEDEEEEDMEPIDKNLWGEIVDEEEMEDEVLSQEQSEAQADFGEQLEREKLLREQQEPNKSGISSVIDGIVTPEVDLRNMYKRDETFVYSQNNDKPLYQILEQVDNNANREGQIFAGHSYIIPDSKK